MVHGEYEVDGRGPKYCNFCWLAGQIWVCGLERTNQNNVQNVDRQYLQKGSKFNQMLLRN